MIRTDREAFIARTEELAARLSRISQPAPPPNTAYNSDTGRWEAPQPEHCVSHRAYDSCTPTRFNALTGQREPIKIAQYDPAFDPDLHPGLEAPVPTPAKLAPVPTPAPDPDAPIPVEWPTRIVQPVPLSREVQP